MNKYLKNFLLRGLAFGGLGPIIAAIVFLCVSAFVEVRLDAVDFALAVISTYLLAFVQAGASIFNQIEEWSLPKSTGVHFLCLYAVYVLTYLVNSWIPFEWAVIGIFTAVFAAVYLVIWLTVFLIVRATARTLNGKIT